MNKDTKEKINHIIDKIGNYNEGAKLLDDTLIIYNEGGYNATTLCIDDLHELSDLLKDVVKKPTMKKGEMLVGIGGGPLLIETDNDGSIYIYKVEGK